MSTAYLGSEEAELNMKKKQGLVYRDTDCKPTTKQINPVSRLAQSHGLVGVANLSCVGPPVCG